MNLSYTDVAGVTWDDSLVRDAPTLLDVNGIESSTTA